MDIFSKVIVLVLAGTKWQIPLIQKLKKKGCKVIVFNSLPDSPAFEYADEFCIVDILDHEECLRLAMKYTPDAIMSEECDIAIPAVTFLSEKMGLISIGSDMGELYTNKFKMRLFGKEHGFNTPSFYKCNTLEEALKIFRFFGKKMILKPMDANSSRGVYSVTCEKDIRLHFGDTISFSKIEKSVLLEEYIDGTEFTVDGIKTEKGHISLAISEKKHYAYNENIASVLYFSHENSKYNYKKLRNVNDRFVELSGLPFGLTHAEYKYKDGIFYLIEIGARGGGNLISSHIVPLISGVDTYDYLIDKTLGKICKETMTISKKFWKRCAILNFFDTEGKEGIVKEIHGEKYLKECKNIIDYCISCKEGDRIVNAKDDSKRIGYYIAYGENKQELENIINQIKKVFQISLESEIDMTDEKEFYESINEIEVSIPIYQEMKQSEFPFVIWGTGSLSYSIKKYMDLYGIKVCSYWVDGMHQLTEKDGIPILSFFEISKKYEKFNVVFGHSRYEKKKELQEKYKNIQEVFCIPNVCYQRYERMEKRFFEKNAKEYYKNFCLLEDEKSKKCMIAYLKCKISENIDDILDVFQEEHINYFENPIFTVQRDEVYIDVGAYIGDSLELFLKTVDYQYKKIYLYEPNEGYVSILKRYIEKKKLENIIVEQKGTWNKKDTLNFNYDEESSSITSPQLEDLTKLIEVNALDTMLEKENVTLVKINFLEGVKETLEGMKDIMLRCKPKLVITVGFDEYALLSIPTLIKKINPSYKLYLRFAAAMPARLLLFAV